MNALLLVTLLCSGLDIGGTVAGVYPVGSLNRHHGSSALLGAAAGWTTGAFRFELGYGYASLPGRQSTPYRLAFHLPRVGVGWSPVRQPGWGLEVGASTGYAFGRRTFGSGVEQGNAALAELGLSFVQPSGRSRLSVGLWYSNLIESGPGTGVVLSPMLSLRAGVAYVP